MDIEMPNSGKTGCGRTMEREFPPELESIFCFFIKLLGSVSLFFQAPVEYLRLGWGLQKNL